MPLTKLRMLPEPFTGHECHIYLVTPLKDELTLFHRVTC